jgi:hypothetical protein
MEQKFNFKEFFLKESIILVVIPILAYYSAYQYMTGYFNVFGAPHDLISVDLATFIGFGSVIFGLAFIFYNILSITWTSILNLDQLPWRQFIITLILLLISLGGIFMFLYGDWKKASLVSASFLVLCVLFYISSKFDSSKAYPQWLFIMVILGVLLTSFSQGVGQFKARHQTEYTVVTNFKNTFVIYKIGDYFLCSTYDINSHTFSKSFRLLPIKDNGLDLEYKNIGPLHSSK